MQLTTRAQFADLCNTRGIQRAVEVGTDRGFFAAPFLERWRGEVLVCVDPWAPYPGMPFDRQADLMMATLLLAPFRERVRMVRLSGRDAAALLADSPFHSPGFVYIDAAHDEASVREDLATWWPLVVPGGILAGHDYMPEAVGVRSAVDAFVAAQGLDLHLTDDLTESRSWWIVKPRA